MSETECKVEETRDSKKYEAETGSFNAKDFIIGALIGSMIGAATALLLTPKSGKDVRCDINKGAKYLSNKTEDIRANAVGLTTEFAEVAKVKTNQLTDKVVKQSSVIMDNVKMMKDKASKKLHEKTEELNPINDEYIAQQKLEELEQAITDSENNITN